MPKTKKEERDNNRSTILIDLSEHGLSEHYKNAKIKVI
jgi:hypothetical protein